MSGVVHMRAIGQVRPLCQVDGPPAPLLTQQPTCRSCALVAIPHVLARGIDLMRNAFSRFTDAVADAIEALPELAVIDPPLSPDCSQGKHRACSGDTWDDALDQLVMCPCDCHDEQCPSSIDGQHHAGMKLSASRAQQCRWCGIAMPATDDEPA